MTDELAALFRDHSRALELLRAAVKNASPCRCGICWHCEVRTWLFTERDDVTGSVEPAGDTASADGAELTAALTKLKLLQWTVDNVYTIARREANRDDPRGRWGHVLRLCEKAGCQPRGVLRAESTPGAAAG